MAENPYGGFTENFFSAGAKKAIQFNIIELNRAWYRIAGFLGGRCYKQMRVSVNTITFLHPVLTIRGKNNVNTYMLNMTTRLHVRLHLNIHILLENGTCSVNKVLYNVDVKLFRSGWNLFYRHLGEFKQIYFFLLSIETG